MRVVHVDSAREWRGSQSQVLLAAQGMSARGHSVTVACQAGGRLEARARAAGLAVRPLVFGGDLAAMPRVLEAVPAARLVVVGDGELRRLLEAEARRLGLGERCVFTGFRTDVDRLIPAFSLLCRTSRTEGLGSSLLDAMCFGRPVVATATGGIPEAVVHGETGLLVPVGDPAALASALTRLLVATGRREALGRAGRRRFEEAFTAEKMVDETLRLYDGLRVQSTRPDAATLAEAGRLPVLADVGPAQAGGTS